MLSGFANEDARAWVRWNMARIVPAGYAQATHLLANADLATDLAGFRGRTAVAVGANDAITPPAACERIAAAAHVGLQVIPQAGHAGYVEAPAVYSALIDTFCRQCDQQRDWHERTAATTRTRNGKAEASYVVPGLNAGCGFSPNSRRAASVLGAPELSKRLGIPRTTVFRLLQTLESLGFLERADKDRNYKLGIAVLRLGFEYLSRWS